MKSKSYINQKLTGWNGTILNLAWVDGTSNQYDCSTLPEVSQLNLMMHGAKQKLRDDTSDAASHADPLQYCKDGADEIWEMLVAGAWKRVKVGAKAADLCEALRRFTEADDEMESKDITACWDVLAPMDAKARVELSNVPAIAGHLADIAKEQADARPSTVDIKGLFG